MKLPQLLLDEINASEGSSSRKRRRLSRNEARSTDRPKQRERKINSSPNHNVSEANRDGLPERKKARTDASHQEQKGSTRRPKSLTRKSEGKRKQDPLRLPPRTAQEEDEDRYIAFLEKQLGYKKGENAKEEGDGLDDLFNFASSIANAEPDQFQKETSYPSEGSAKSEDDDDEEEEEEEEEEGDSESWSDSEEWGGIEKGVDDSEPKSQSNVNTTIVSKYIPPQARHKIQAEEESSETLQRLKRQLNGLLNRMSELNMMSILEGVEELFRKHRRHDLTTMLTSLIIDAVASHSSHLDSFVVLYAAFVSSLQRILGIEFAAYFVQSVVSSYERHLATSSSVPTDGMGKECSNLIVLISELYNFQVTSCILVYDIIRDLLAKELSELNVELLLKILRNSGQQLRQDDPAALKDIIQVVQGKTPTTESSSSSRTRFMIETLTDLKNNKLKRNITQNQGGEAVERMKKFLANLSKKRHVMAHEPLRVTLDDLRSAESKGKWWLVGAAWGGDPLVDRQNVPKAETDHVSAEDKKRDDLLKLARSQGMNTDIRRSIFVVLISSDDFVDACERLSQLNLTEIQQREIVRVILHCCGNEKSYNPYYTLVCQRLCQHSTAHKFTLQFCLWDFLRDLGETTVGGPDMVKDLDDSGKFEGKAISRSQIKNTAKAYAWWIAKNCTSLAILKPVDFTSLKPQSKLFLKELISQIIVYSQSPNPLATVETNVDQRDRSTLEMMFLKAANIQPLGNGLAWFLSKSMKAEREGDLIDWGLRIGRGVLQT